jgi:hypothetical protein
MRRGPEDLSCFGPLRGTRGRPGRRLTMTAILPSAAGCVRFVRVRVSEKGLFASVPTRKPQ